MSSNVARKKILVFLGFDRKASINVGFFEAMLEGSGGHVNVGFSSMPFQ